MARIRQNFLLKFISLAASILLYFYVQGERNPTVARSFIAQVVRQNVPSGIEVESDSAPVEIKVSGPKSIMETIKDSDVRIIADFKGVSTDQVAETKVRTQYDVQGLSAERREELVFDPIHPNKISVQLFPHRQLMLPVTVHYPGDAPVGFRYGPAAVFPPRARLSGRADRVVRADHVDVIATSDDAGAGAGIDGDFPLIARDAQGNVLEGVTVIPDMAHVIVPLFQEPYSKVVSISPVITDQPLPSYRLTDISVTPNQVRIVGRPDQVDRIATILTEGITVRDRMENASIQAALVIPNAISIRDNAGKAVDHVMVQLTISRTENGISQSPGPKPDGSATLHLTQ